MPPSHFPRCSVTDIFSEVFRQSEKAGVILCPGSLASVLRFQTEYFFMNIGREVSVVIRISGLFRPLPPLHIMGETPWNHGFSGLAIQTGIL